jgi:hypothetical protein
MLHSCRYTGPPHHSVPSLYLCMSAAWSCSVPMYAVLLVPMSNSVMYRGRPRAASWSSLWTV